MLRNYLAVAFRSLSRNKVYSLINVLGLALGISCSLVIFRARDMTHAGEIFRKIFSMQYWGAPLEAVSRVSFDFWLVIIFMVIEWFRRHEVHPLGNLKGPAVFRWSVYYAIVFLIVLLGEFNYVPFIYFQF